MGHFQRIAGGRSERLAHVGNERGGGKASAIGDIDEALGQFLCVGHARHEGAGAHLHVEHEVAQPGGELLGEDGGSDERHGLDRRRHVADAIEAFVGRRQVRRLADDGAARFARRLAEEIKARLGGIAGDRVELVQRAASVTEAPARDHRHVTAAGGEHGCEHEREIVADAAGGMLVDHRARQIPLQHGAGIAHGERQAHRLLAAHAAEEHRHGEGRDLPLGYGTRGEARDELLDVLAFQGCAIALPADQLLRQHLRRP